MAESQQKHSGNAAAGPVAFLEDLRGYIRACIGDAEGERAVEQHRVLTLTAGQVQCLAEALDLIDAAIDVEAKGA